VIITTQSLYGMACNAAYMHAVMCVDLGSSDCMQKQLLMATIPVR